MGKIAINSKINNYNAPCSASVYGEGYALEIICVVNVSALTLIWNCLKLMTPSCGVQTG